MKLYKKNPKIEGAIGVEGVGFDDNSVVAGYKFEKWANPDTFLGWTPSLVEVAYSELTLAQVKAFDKYSKENNINAVPNLGGITTANFFTTDDGDASVKEDNIAPPVAHEAPAPKPEKDDPEVKAKEEVEVVDKEVESEEAPEGAEAYEEVGEEDGEEVDEEDGEEVGDEEDGEEVDEEDGEEVGEEDGEEVGEEVGEEDGGVLSDYSQDYLCEMLSGVTNGNIASILDNFKTLEQITKASNVELRVAGIRSNFFQRLRESAKEVYERGEE